MNLFFDELLGIMVLQLAGASVRWSFYTIIALIRGQEKPSFIEIYEGTNEDDSNVLSGNALLNGVIGLIAVLGALFLAFWLST